MARPISELGDFDWLKQWARLAPSNIAFKDAQSGTEYSYESLYYLSCRIANELEKRFSVRSGTRVAMLATNEIEVVALFFATLRLGAILVPVNFRLTARELEHIFGDCSPELVVMQDTFKGTIASIDSSQRPKQIWSFEEYQAFVSSALKEPRIENFARPLMAGETCPCMILYTSGTTGAPKGACITPKMLHWNSLNTTLRLNLSQNDVFVSFLPFFHTGGWNVLLTPFVHRGAKTIITRKFEPDRILALCESEGATIMFGVPTTMEMMARSPLFGEVKLEKVRYAIVGGEPMPIELIKTWQAKGIAIRQGFGLTEFGPNVFSLNEEDAIRKIGSIGFPNFYVETRVVNEDLREVAAGEIGELLLRGPVCTPGYWNNDAATADAIVDGWFRTGDLVRFDSEGYFYVAGRKKDMFISGGENVYPVEVERVLSQHPAVREVAVVGVPDSRWGEVGCAYIAVTPGSDVNSDTLIQFCSDKLAKFKIPKKVEFLDTLPKGDSGKILKRMLRDQTQRPSQNETVHSPRPGAR